MNANVAPAGPLRASCDRCRAQKLRCLPSSETDPTAPCQRCLKAKSPKSCLFSRRSRTGRYRKNTGDVEARPARPRQEENDISTPALPGMTVFALSTPSPSPPEEAHRTLGSPRAKDKLLDDNMVTTSCAPGGSLADLCDYDNTVLHSFCLDLSLQQPLNFFFGADSQAHPDESSASEPGDGVTASVKEDYTFAHLDVQDFLLSPPDAMPTDMGVDMDMLAAEKPGPLVDLTALLAEMSQYQNQLSKLPGGELNNYPIGDALFLSQRFYAILSDYGDIPPADPSSHLDMPTMLLTLSCYMTLTFIYLSVFGYLHKHLSQLPDAHSVHSASRPSHPFMADMHACRGLSLSQLQPICLCACWDPAKKAVSMLLGSLCGVEGVLGLPPDVRAIVIPRAEAQGEGGASQKWGGGERTVLFEEEMMVALTNGRLYKTLRQQARELRGKVEEVNDLLKGLLEM